MEAADVVPGLSDGVLQRRRDQRLRFPDLLRCDFQSLGKGDLVETLREGQQGLVATGPDGVQDIPDPLLDLRVVRGAATAECGPLRPVGADLFFHVQRHE